MDTLSFEIPHGLPPQVISALEGLKPAIERHYNGFTNPADRQAYIGALRTWAESVAMNQGKKSATGGTQQTTGKAR